MTLVIIIIILILCWPVIKKWTARILSQFVAHRTEDYIRRATGMPPRPGSREAKKQARREQSSSRASGSSGRSTRTQSRSAHSDGPLIPKEYAVDVEFTETIDYSETEIASDGKHTTAYSYHESQVSDVEWEEIKVKK